MAYQVLVTTYANSGAAGAGIAVDTIVLDFALESSANLAISNINGQQYISYSQRAVPLY